MPGWVDYEFVQSASNVMLFVAPGVLFASLSEPQLSGAPGVLVLIFSLCIELTQYWFLSGRTAAGGIR